MSKRRSVANCVTLPPDEPVFFIDRSLGRHHIADALRKAGARVEVHFDHFPDDAPDATWLETVGRKGWIVLAKDRRIRFRTIEKRALLSANVGAVILRTGNLTGPAMAELFVRALPAIRRLIERRRRPFIAMLMRDGTLKDIDLEP